MLYFDTSFIAPLYIPEPNSDEVRQLTYTLSQEYIAISEWTCVEFSSMVARRVRMQQLRENAAHGLLAAFERIAHTQFVILTPSQADYRLADLFLRNFASGLRAGDALHLAIARNNGAQHVYSLDQGLIKAAAILNISASSGF
ncbi:MAG: type II toxin-antitoxin system VapC family toxin [Sulfurimicrobium sp.]|nr:type II toxin-antitoxin system VapC family toxin [Sulfurimicrobium sp.]